VFFNNQSSTGGVHNDKMVLKEKKIEVKKIEEESKTYDSNGNDFQMNKKYIL